MNKNSILGAHIFGIVDPLEKFEMANMLGLQAMQIFTASNLSYTLKNSLKINYINQFLTAQKLFPHISVYSHACYLLNLANTENTIGYQRSLQSLIMELHRCHTLGIKGTVIHPGSYFDRKKGIENIASTINDLFVEYTGSSQLYIESSAGQGNTLPVTILEIASLCDQLNRIAKKKTKFVIDTCHVHAAGYDLSSDESVNTFFAEYDRLIGLEKVALIHLNDSKCLAGKKIDRHENIGKGTIGETGMSAILNHRDLSDIPKILETPVNTNEEFSKDIEMIDQLMQ